MFTVFGADGFIGGHLVRHLAEAGEMVTMPPREGTPAPGRLGHVIYAIGLTANFRARPLDTMEAHVGRLVDLLREGRFDSFTYLSSTRVYRKAGSGHEDATLAVSPSDPSDLYNLSKLAGEAACLALGHPAVRVARLSNIFGPGMKPENFLAAIVAEACAGALHLMSHPDSEKDYLPVEDAVRALRHVALAGTARVYNVAAGVNVTHGALAEQLRALTGCRLSVAQDAPRAAFPRIEVSRLRALLAARGEDWRPDPPQERLAGLIADQRPEELRRTGS